MQQSAPSITCRRVDPDGELSNKFREHLHKLVDPVHSIKNRIRSTLPEGSVVLVAELHDVENATNGLIQIGSVAIKPLTAGEPTSEGLSSAIRYGEIKRMVVLPKYQGSGVAVQLLTAIEEIGKTDLDLQCIVLETLHALPQARRFYEKNGYQKRSVYGVYDSEQSQCYEKWLCAGR